MDRNAQKIGFVNLIVAFATGLTAAFLAQYSHTLAGMVGSLFFGVAFLITAVAYFQMRLEESERLEKMEFDELTRDSQSSSLFTGSEGETLPAQRSRRQFQKFFVPAFGVLLFILEAGAVYFLWRWLGDVTPAAIERPAVALALYSVFFLSLFLLGKYSANLARIDNKPLLGAGATYLILLAYLSAVTAISIAFVAGGVPKVDLWVARALVILLGLIAVETLLTLILEMYRPRLKGTEARPLYDSRFVALLATPESLMTRAAQALDYQFGFKVSETWFYRFLRRALAWLVIAQAVILVLSTSFVFIEPGEEGLLERFGRPVTANEAMAPGIHLKLPWPIDKVYREHTGKVQQFNIGFVHEPEEGEAPDRRAIVWTVSHYDEEYHLLVARRGSGATGRTGPDQVPADLITVSIPVQYRIKDLQAWTYNYEDSAKLLKDLGEREVLKYLVSVDIFDIMSSGRSQAAQDLQRMIQSRADELGIGVEILLVGLQDIHPPVSVAEAYEQVIGAVQEKEAAILGAQGYAARTRAMARAQADQIASAAEADYFQRVGASQGQAGLFTNQVAAFNASPEVFAQRAYLEAFARGSANSRKYFLSTTNTRDVINLNLEDKTYQDLQDVVRQMPSSRR